MIAALCDLSIATWPMPIVKLSTPRAAPGNTGSLTPLVRHEDIGLDSVAASACCKPEDTAWVHYNCNGQEDRGWGCAYRCLQMLLVNLRDSPSGQAAGNEAPVNLPSLTAIQRDLVSMKMLPEGKVGSTEWIEPPHAAAWLEWWAAQPRAWLSEHRTDCGTLPEGTRLQVAQARVEGGEAVDRVIRIWQLLETHFRGSKPDAAAAAGGGLAEEGASSPQGSHCPAPVMIDDSIVAMTVAGIRTTAKPMQGFGGHVPTGSHTATNVAAPMAEIEPKGSDPVWWRPRLDGRQGPWEAVQAVARSERPTESQHLAEQALCAQVLLLDPHFVGVPAGDGGIAASVAFRRDAGSDRPATFADVPGAATGDEEGQWAGLGASWVSLIDLFGRGRSKLWMLAMPALQPAAK